MKAAAMGLAGLMLLGTSPVAMAQGVRFAPGFAFETYSFSTPDVVGLTSVRLVSAPLGATIQGERVRFELRGAFARGEIEDGSGTTISVSGLTDAHLRADVAVVPDQVTFTARAILPTGTTGLAPEEFVVASVLSSDLLPFRVSGWGSGGGLALGATLARRFGGLGLGVGAEWRRSGEFEPLAEAPAYRAGDQVSAQVALDGDVGEGARASVRVAYRSYGDDTFDGGGLFRAGTRLEALASVGFPTRRGGSAAVFAGLLHRGNGEYLAAAPGSEAAPTQDLVLAGALWRLAIGGGWVQPRADVRLYRTEDGVGQGYTVSAGASAELPLGPAVTLVPAASARFGTVEGSATESTGFTGFEVGAALRFGR